MDWVLPGEELVFATPFLFRSVFISDDLPTFDLPEKAISAIYGFGRSPELNTLFENLT
jgi:hypothetical protein